MSVPVDAPSPRTRAHTVVTRARRAIVAFAAALGDYVRRVWLSSGEDRIFFLAGGIAFNLMLAAVPFVLLLIAGLTVVLGLSTDASVSEVIALADRFLPPHLESANAPLHRFITDVVASRRSIGAWGLVVYIWASTRLFGSLRTVLADIFDIETERGVLIGKWFDVRITVYSSILLLVWIALSLYLAVARTRGLNALMAVGLRQDVMGAVEYAIGRAIAFAFVVLIFFSLYKVLPNRKIRWRQAMVGALSSAVLLELARNAWTAVTRSFDPGSVYTGTLYALISVVFWVYYASMIFVLGGEVAQAQELRRVRRLQRARFDV
ncbi:MAG: YihY/virulence factor BrkB family protein [Gemmatimonadaceae bacterium]|nr:YihY/virulence factor BrkB family protein [Gemmatimonadaceae bacterium]